MGEYAKYGREEIKIGTCEDMYYLRWDQRRMVQKLSGSLDVNDLATQNEIRFRFPWPDEDGTPPGAFEGDHDRAVGISGATFPGPVDHTSVQFSAHAGYLVSLPCPEAYAAQIGAQDDGLSIMVAGGKLKIHRNGFGGRVKICQQAVRDGHLVLIARCGGCGARFRYPTIESVQPVIDACRKEADRRGSDGVPSDWWTKVADRIAEGYALEVTRG